jgi:hypothetical protein
LLVWWAGATASAIPLPALPVPEAGGAVAALGLALVATGMYALVRHGRGLPMNAFPPPVYVSRSVYRWVSHPIYLGFAMAVLGVSWQAGSPSGTWLVSPVVMLAVAALVMGYERHDLRRRFGAAAIHRPFLSLPPNDPAPATVGEKTAVLLLLGIPWSLAFEGICWLGPTRGSILATMPFERSWPVLEWTEIVYGLAYPFVVVTPFLVKSRRDLRDLGLLGLVATAIVIPFYLVAPFVAPPRAFEPRTMLGAALMVERAMCNTVASLPSFHVIWALIAARAWATRSKAWGIAGWTMAFLVAASCVTTGMHAIADVAAGVVAYVAIVRWRAGLEWLRRAAERTANSWREWRWGPVRLLSYAFPASVAGAAGFLVAAALGGPRAVGQLGIVYACGLVGAALWAQRLEGSSRLCRPFGFYGSVIGVAAGIVSVGAVLGDTMWLTALMAMAAPWIQAIGRLRCLVQGCCFGAPAPESVGIRYTEPRSRVCAHAGLAGIPLYPTPLYSLLANVVTGFLLWRLWQVGAAYSLSAGLYLILGGVARFVEESYRGEPQTPIVGGLRLYQWLAVASLLAGIVLTTISSASPPPDIRGPGLVGWLMALLVAIVVGVAMGVDLPGSQRRYARLAPP